MAFRLLIAIIGTLMLSSCAFDVSSNPSAYTDFEVGHTYRLTREVFRTKDNFLGVPGFDGTPSRIVDWKTDDNHRVLSVVEKGTLIVVREWKQKTTPRTGE